MSVVIAQLRRAAHCRLRRQRPLYVTLCPVCLVELPPDWWRHEPGTPDDVPAHICRERSP